MLEKGYKERMEAKYREWSEEIDKLKSRMQATVGETRESVSEYCDELAEKQKVVRKKLNELGTSTEKGYEQVKTGVENSFHDLRKAIDRAIAKVKQATKFKKAA